MAARKTPSAGGKPDKIMRDALSLELHEEVPIPPEMASRFSNAKKIRRMRLVAIALVNEAIKGNVAAIQEINNRMDGRVPTEVRGGGKDGAFEFDINNLQNMSDDVLNGLIDKIFASLSGPRSPTR